MPRSRKLLVFGAAMLVFACNALSGVGDLETGCVEDCGAPSVPDASDASIDSAVPVDANDAGPTIDADAGPIPLCDPGDPSLILCLAFDGNALDGAGTPLVGAAAGVTYDAGHVAQAAFFTNGGIVFPYAPKLDVTAVTIEAFIAPTSLPAAGQRMGIVDSDGRFAAFLTDTMLECRGGSGVNVASAPAPGAGKVSHFACVVENLTITAYVNGTQVATAAVPTPIPKTSSGVAVGRNDPVGDPFAGMIDELRIYNRARTAAEIGADAARGK